VSAGQHVITVSATEITGNTGTSSPVTVTVDNSNPPNTIGENATVSGDGGGLMQTPKFSVTNPGNLPVAFVAYDGPQMGNKLQPYSAPG
jgi:hypothetical protein